MSETVDKPREPAISQVGTVSRPRYDWSRTHAALPNRSEAVNMNMAHAEGPRANGLPAPGGPAACLRSARGGDPRQYPGEASSRWSTLGRRGRGT